MTDNASTTDNGLESGSGGVWVKDGKLYVKDPDDDNVILSVAPCEGVEVVINGAVATGGTIIREKDEIVLKPLTVEEPGSYNINVAPDYLSVKLEIVPGKTTSYKIVDTGPRTKLRLRTVSKAEKKCPCALVDILQALSEKNITFGIKHGEIAAILDRLEEGSYLIAEGEAPGETVDDRVELKFNAGQGEQKIDDTSDRVDFRDLWEIPSVDPGTLLAKKFAGRQGKPGRKVNGEMIIPPEPVPCDIIPGKGAEITGDGLRVISKFSGRPTAKRLGKGLVIDVEPVFQKNGDVDIRSGNIRFKGDVVVHGNVCEGMIVQAAGKVNIYGMIFGAQVAAQGNIVVGKNITGSNLVAGGNNSFLRAIYKHLNALQSDLSGVGSIVLEMAGQAKQKNIKTGQLIQLLIDKKYARVPNLISEITKMSEQNSFIIPGDMIDLLDTIEKKLSGLNVLKISSPGEFNRIIADIKDVRNNIENMAQDKANITFAYSVNSRIEATGDVKVEGGGCINTNINAGGDVSIKGVFRGGEIHAGGNIILNEAGSEMGARTLLKTESKKKIMIRKAHEGVHVQIGGRSANIKELQNNIKAELDDEGALVFS